MSVDFENQVREAGLRLYQYLDGDIPSLFDKQSWMGKTIDWCLHHEQFKVAFFRFIDVLPYLTTPESLTKHFEEYFCRPERPFTGALHICPGDLSRKPGATREAAKTLADNIEKMAHQFIAARTPEETIPVFNDLRSRGMAFSADLLGEAVVSEGEAETYLDRCLDLFDILHEAQGRWKGLGNTSGELDWGHAAKINVSIKPSALYSQMTPRAFDYAVSRGKERLRPIFRKAINIGAHVCLDMEQYDLKNLTLASYKSLLEEPEFKGYPHSGTVIQTYLKGIAGDLRDLVTWARGRKQKLTIRLVKGAYWEAEMVWARKRGWNLPFYRNKHETDANFEKQARYLLENHEWVNLACASQNIRSIAFVMALSEELKVPREHLEYQVLYGMAEPLRKALRKAGLPLRIYAPTGEMIPGMAYLVRRLLENTSKESFLRQSFAENVSPGEHLKNPLEFLGEGHFHSEDQPEMSQKTPFQNEPERDWSVQAHRDRFNAALKDMRKAFPCIIALEIGGKEVTTKKKIQSRNPSDPEEIVCMASSAGIEEAEKALEAAKSAFPSWRNRSPEERAEYLFRAAAVARKLRYELAAIEVFEVGKNWSEADADVCEGIDFLEYYGREMIRLSVPQPMGKIPGEESHLFYEPRGVAAVIAPWNFPFAISMGMTSAALVTGNTVVYKPSSNSVLTGYMIYRVFGEAGLPAGALNFLSGSGEALGHFFAGHRDTALIAFTGSREVGLRIVEWAGKTPENARHVKHVVAELGGKNAIIIDSDADLDEAVVQVLQSAFGYQGQKCSACSRLIVLEEQYDSLMERLKAAAESVEIGPAERPETFMGAVIDETAKRKILRYINIGKREGKVLLERTLPDAKGYAVPLTIFTDILTGHRMAQEEIFGPVLVVMKVRDFEEALDVANSTPYALTGALFSRSPENIKKARKAFRVGNLYINQGCTGAIVGRHPFGGFRMSGMGSKAGGPDYLLQFMVPRNIAENTLRRGFAP